MTSVAPASVPALSATSEEEYTLTGTSCWVVSGDQSLLICRTADEVEVLVFATGKEDQEPLAMLRTADHQTQHTDALSTLWEAVQ